MCAAIETASWYFACAVHCGLKRCEWFQSATTPFTHVHAAHKSEIARHQNDVLRVLTVFSVLLLPLTLIASVFGMNVHFPGFDTSAGFWVILAGMVVTLVAALGFFRLKRWL